MEKREEKEKPSGQAGSRSAASTATSGFASDVSVKGSEGSSGSGREEKAPKTGSSKVPSGLHLLDMAKRGEWLRLENILRTTPKGHLDLSTKDKVGPALCPTSSRGAGRPRSGAGVIV